MAGIGHNSGEEPAEDSADLVDEAAQRLKSIIERIERMEEEKKAVADDIKEIYAEAKGVGFDTKILRKVVQLRKMDREERLEQEAILETYLNAIGEP